MRCAVAVVKAAKCLLLCGHSRKLFNQSGAVKSCHVKFSKLMPNHACKRSGHRFRRLRGPPCARFTLC